METAKETPVPLKRDEARSFKGRRDYRPILEKVWAEAMKHPSNSTWRKIWFYPKVLTITPYTMAHKWWYGSNWGGNKNTTLTNVVDDIYYVRADFSFPPLFSVIMNIVKGGDGSLLLHNLVPVQPKTVEDLKSLGNVKHIFVASCFHDNFVDDWREVFPDAMLIGDKADSTFLEESFPMNGYWQDEDVARELRLTYGIEFIEERGFAMGEMKEFADQVAVITTSSDRVVMIAPHLFTNQESTFSSYFFSWLLGLQGEPLCPNWDLCYLGEKVGARESFKRAIEKFKPEAILAWHSKPWLGLEVDRLKQKL